MRKKKANINFLMLQWAVDDKQDIGPRTIEEVLKWLTDRYIPEAGYAFIIDGPAVRYVRCS